MTRQQWEDLVSNQFDIETVDGQMMKCLAMLPELMQRGRYALRSPSQPTCTLLHIQMEVRHFRDSFGPKLESLRKRWIDSDSSVSMQFVSPHLKAILHAHYSRSYGMALAIEILINCILAALEGSTGDLNDESSQLSDEVLNLAKVVDRYRPLGTLYMIISLVAAWVGTPDPTKKEIVRARLIIYQRDVQGPSATMSSEHLEFIKRRFYLK